MRSTKPYRLSSATAPYRTALTVARRAAAIFAVAAAAACRQAAPAVTAVRPMPPMDMSSLPQRARAYIGLLGARAFDEAAGWHDNTMRTRLPPAKLAVAWDEIVAQVGAFGSVGETHVWAIGALRAVHAETVCERATVEVTVTFDAGGRVAGLWFRRPWPTWTPPLYAVPSAFIERDLDVALEPKLSATVTMPVGTGPFPIAVLVHGSGPNDRDETSGGSKLFKDLAWGLASRRVAVLRYEKRAHQYPRSQAVTYDDEVVDDACAVVRDAASLPRVDPTRVFVIGHSLGAGLAPRVAARARVPVAGVVLMAGATRPMDRLLRDQTRYLLGLRRASTSTIDDAVRALDAAFAKAREPGPPGEMIEFAGAALPRSYVAAQLAFSPRSEAMALGAPMLVLQGERDYQVTAADDYEGYRAALSGRADVSFRLYPGLDHHFVAGEGPSSPVDYQRPGHVDARVIADVAGWIGTGRPP